MSQTDDSWFHLLPLKTQEELKALWVEKLSLKPPPAEVEIRTLAGRTLYFDLT